MENVTLSLDEDVFAVARRYAVEHDSSVDALVRELLAGIAEREGRARGDDEGEEGAKRRRALQLVEAGGP